MSDYIDLYNIDRSSIDPSTFSASFVTIAPEDLPSGCQLPTTPSLPSMPPGLTPPDLACKFDISTPIIPPPYFCSPSVSGGIGFGLCSQAITDGFAITGSAEIARDDTECGYSLGGGFTLCAPCIPKVTTDVSITTCSAGGHNSLVISPDTELNIVYDAETCTYNLAGDFGFCVPCIPTVTGTLTIDNGTVDANHYSLVGSNITFTPDELDSNGNPCNYNFNGSIGITGPCIGPYTVEITHAANSIPDQTGPTFVESVVALDPCGTNTELSFTYAACTNPNVNVSFESIAISLSGPLSGSGSLSLSASVAEGDTQCDNNIAISGSGSITLSGDVVTSVDSTPISNVNVCSDTDEDIVNQYPSLQATLGDDGYSLSLIGGIPTPCFSCLETPKNAFTTTEMELYKLGIASAGQITWSTTCDSCAALWNEQGALLNVADCVGDNYINLNAQDTPILTIQAVDESNTTLTPTTTTITSSDASTTLTTTVTGGSASISLTDGDMSATMSFAGGETNLSLVDTDGTNNQDSSSMTLNRTGAGEVIVSAAALSSGQVAEFRTAYFCSSGEIKTALVLMTLPS